MHRSRHDEHIHLCGSIENMLHQLRPFLAEGRYKSLCREVREAEDYAEQRSLIQAVAAQIIEKRKEHSDA